MSGHYRLHRGWQEHPVFAAEPFSKRDAWVWLIEHAAWKSARVGVSTKVIQIERGQLCYSLRFMAKAWKWDEAKVRRFISRLVREKMIVCVADAGQNVVTICNYNEYQADASVADADTAAATTQPRRSDDANKKELNNLNTPAADAVANTPWATVGLKVMDIMDVRDDPKWLGDARPAERWLAWGADPELDIYPTVRVVMKRYLARGIGPPKGLNYFDAAISDAIALRQRPRPEVSNVSSPSPTKPARPTRDSDRRTILEALNLSPGSVGMGDYADADGPILDGEYRRSH